MAKASHKCQKDVALVMTNVKETRRLINRATIVIISPLDGKVSVHDFNTGLYLGLI